QLGGGGLAHQRIHGGGQGCAAVWIELTAHQHHAVERGQGEAAAGEVGGRVGLDTIRVDVRDDPVAEPAEGGGVQLPGAVGENLISLGGYLDADPVGQPGDPVEVIGGDVAVGGRRRQGR